MSQHQVHITRNKLGTQWVAELQLTPEILKSAGPMTPPRKSYLDIGRGPSPASAVRKATRWSAARLPGWVPVFTTFE